MRKESTFELGQRIAKQAYELPVGHPGRYQTQSPLVEGWRGFVEGGNQGLSNYFGHTLNDMGVQHAVGLPAPEINPTGINRTMRDVGHAGLVPLAAYGAATQVPGMLAALPSTIKFLLAPRTAGAVASVPGLVSRVASSGAARVGLPRVSNFLQSAATNPRSPIRMVENLMNGRAGADMRGVHGAATRLLSRGIAVGDAATTGLAFMKKDPTMIVKDDTGERRMMVDRLPPVPGLPAMGLSWAAQRGAANEFNGDPSKTAPQ